MRSFRTWLRHSLLWWKCQEEAMNITREEYNEIEQHAHNAYSDGAYPDTLVHLVVKKLGVTVDGEPLGLAGFQYKHGPHDKPVTEWEWTHV